ncbi:ribonuclease HII [uncultured Sphingomonas sp.]|uniref:ribonuclease HII n=1 Tax=uncultured Sphingomonas sp. TaxID=158754 RepID=UPI0035CB4A51
MPHLKHERRCLPPVAGVDEAGRGPLAGPVVAAAVVLPAKGVPRGIDDSKKLSAAERERLCALLHERACVGIGVVEADEIDRLNIYWATMKAMTLAVEALAECLGAMPGHILVDGNRLPRWSFAATAIVGGDALSLSIAAASVIAKHTRDTIMLAHADTHPHYGWHSNKGYGAPAHLQALRDHGPSPLHRHSFAPVAAAARARMAG